MADDEVIEPLERIPVDKDAPLSIEDTTPDAYDPALDGDDSALKDAMP